MTADRHYESIPPEVAEASGEDRGSSIGSPVVDGGAARAVAHEDPPAEPAKRPVEPSVPSGEPEAPVTPPSPATPKKEDEQEPGSAPRGEPGPQEEVDVAALSAKAAKADEYLNLAQRTRAEFENYRKRAVREAATAQDRGATKLALALLPALDNLDRALAHADQAAGQEEASSDNGTASFVAGIRHVQADVLAALTKMGIEPFSPQGERFDPQLHEAVAQQPIQGAEPGTVVEVYQRGYRQGESVLRPARVVVAG